MVFFITVVRLVARMVRTEDDRARCTRRVVLTHESSLLNELQASVDTCPQDHDHRVGLGGC